MHWEMIVPITQVIATHEGQEVYRGEFPPGEYTIGRESAAHIHIDLQKISRAHARLTLRYSDWLIEDLGSANGTWVSGTRIGQPTLLFPRQEVRLGTVDLTLRRIHTDAEIEQSRAPQSETVLRFLPAELRDDRRYQIKRLLAKGGMGVVLEAYDAALRRRVAMKVLLDVESPEQIARFIEEAQVTAQLAHPNIIPVYDINVNERENPFFTMPLLDGFTLWSALAPMRRGDPEMIARFPLPEMVHILGKVCDALSFAHARGVVHRDLKPENIMLGEFGEVLVIDWGLAKPLGSDVNVEQGDTTVLVSSVRQDAGLEFATGDHVLGTIQYMAPEQIQDRYLIDARTDVYALGGLLYHILTLRPPVEGTDPLAALGAVMRGELNPFDASTVNCEELALVATKALAHEPHNRHASVREFQLEMRQAFTAGPQGR
jgi:serine/threonine protein kinase